MKRILAALLALLLAFAPALAESPANYYHSSKGYSIALPEGWFSQNLEIAGAENSDLFFSADLSATLELIVVEAPGMVTRDLSELDGRSLEYLTAMGCTDVVAGLYETHGENEFYCCAASLLGIALLRYAVVIDGVFYLLDFINATPETAATVLKSLTAE